MSCGLGFSSEGASGRMEAPELSLLIFLQMFVFGVLYNIQNGVPAEHFTGLENAVSSPGIRIFHLGTP